MSEFKIVGEQYVSEWNGNSLNAGTATSPFAHPADVANATNGLKVVGTGSYLGAMTKSNWNYIADGKVVLDLNGASTNNGGETSGSVVVDGFHFKNGIYITDNKNVTTAVPFLINCIFEDILGINIRHQKLFNRNIILPNTNGLFAISRIVTNENLAYPFENNLVFENVWGAAASYVNPNNLQIFRFCFLVAGKKIKYFGTSANFTNNCINGKVEIGGVDYELKKLVDGSNRPDADPLIPDLATATNFSNCYTNGNFAGDPKFIDVLNRIVESDSPLLRYSNGIGFIGGVRAGKYIPVNSSDPDITITSTNINTSDSLNWLIQSPATEGFINIVWKLSDNISEIQRIFVDALLEFRGLVAGGSAANNNVPDNFPASYTPLSQAGLKPNRLLYELRTSQSIAKPTIDSQWDNDNVALGTTVGAFYKQEWNTKPTITTVLGVRYGNGDPTSIGGSANGINARWGHAKIRLTNNRSF